MAYQSFLRDVWETPHASMLLVAMHNLVTKSIDRDWFPEGRGLTYCYTDVVQKLGQLVDGPKPAVCSHDVPDDVPGLGSSSTPHCSAPA